MKNKFTKIILLMCLIALNISAIQAQQLAFPSAEGFGRFTSGGRGGIVYEVTNLNDSGPGSLRAGCLLSGARTIVFRVSGTIPLRSDIRITSGNLTIAGQTAPGDGICTRDYEVSIEASNVIIRYMRFRVGRYQVAINPLTTSEPDALHSNGGNLNNIIVDHCSMSWSVDETGSFYDNQNVSVQWCILSESLFNAGHFKGAHGYGGIQGGMNASFHHNLYADHTSRNPRFCGARYHQPTASTEIVDFRNNVIFNWGNINSAYGGEWGHQNMVNNYYKSGPATSSKKDRIVEIARGNTNSGGVNDMDPGVWYITGNYVNGYATISADNWAGGVQGADAFTAGVKSLTEFGNASSTIVTQTPQDAYDSVVAKAGANFPSRDAVDTRVINQVISGVCTTGGSYGANTGIIDSSQTVGGWPTLVSTTPPTDTDQDGMPDSWEDAHGLTKTYAGDRNFVGADGYTMLEKYLNCLVAGSVASATSTCTAIPTYTLNLNVNGATGSACTVTATPAMPAGGYAEGSVVTLTTNAATDSIFQNWTGDVTGTTSSITVTMTSNKSVTANFVSSVGMIFHLNTTVIGPGSVTFSPDSTGGYVSGTVVTVTAVPTGINTFTSWLGDLSGTTNPTTITMSNNKTITAQFQSATAKKVAYVTNSASAFYANDTQIKPGFYADPRFIVTEVLPTTTDFSPYDVVVFSEVPGSIDPGVSGLKGINKPFLMMKVHSYKYDPAAWQWTNITGTPLPFNQNASETNVVVAASSMSHPMFSRVTFVNGNEVNMLSSVLGTPGKGLTYMDPTKFTSVTNGTITSIATIGGATGSLSQVSILEIPVGTTVAGTYLNQPFIQIGINSTSYANVTTDGVNVVLDACYYLAQSVNGIKKSSQQLSNIACYPTMVNDVMTVDLSETKGGNAIINILSITGQVVFTKEINSGNKTDLNLSELLPGLYFCNIQNEDGVANQKIIKK